MSRVMLDRAIDRQNRVWTSMQEVTQRAEAEKRDMTAEERRQWDAWEAELDEASSDIQRFERQIRQGGRDTDPSRGAPSGEPADVDPDKRHAEAFSAFLRSGMSGITAEQRQILAGLRGDADPALRAAAAGIDPSGGYMVPEGFRNTMIETMKDFGGLASLVTVITTDSGEKLPWPTNDDTANEGEIIGENVQVSEQDFTFGARELQSFIFSSKATRLPFTLLQDSGFNLDTWVPRKHGERIGRRAARAWTQGTGIGQPQGITVGLSVGKQGTTGQTTSIIYDDLIDLEHSVDPAYRGRAKYGLHDLLLKSIRKLKDQDLRPLWVPVPAPGFPATINGYAYTVDNSMPAPAASAKSMVFGDLEAAYIIRIVRGISTLRLTERYADYLQVGFLSFARMDGMVQDAAAAKTYQHSAS